MASNELLEIRMKLLGASQVAHEGERAGKGISKVGDASSRTAKKTGVLSRAYSKLSTTAKYGLLAIGTTGVFALKNAVTATTELSKTTTGLSRNLGISTQAASRWGAVAQAREIDTKQLAGTFGILSGKATEAARKGGTLLTPFHQLGISQQELVKHGGKFNWLLLRTAKALGDEEGGTKRMTAAKGLLGKGYATLLPLFSEGTKGLKEQLHWADKYGVTLDGKTNDSVMEFVSAQRESKVAMLGLKVGLATTLMPALSDAEGTFQKFVRVLNSDLTTEQKINHVRAMFEKLQGTLIKVISDALPKVAEGGGKLGIALAGAVWTGFKNSGLVGKLVISAWLFKYMGGGGLIKTVSGKAGKAIALGLMKVLFPTLAAELGADATLSKMMSTKFKGMGKIAGRAFMIGVFIGLATLGYWLGQKLGTMLEEKTHGAFGRWARNAAQNFVNTFIRLVNKGMDDANIFSFLGVDAPNIGEVNFHSPHERLPHKDRFAPGYNPNATHHKPLPQPHNSGKGGKREPQMRTQHIHLHMDGKEIAYGVLREGRSAAALA